MYRYPILLFALPAFLWALPLSAAEAALSEVIYEEPQITAVITGPDDIQTGKTLILDGSASHVTGERTSYRWSIDETKQFIGQNVVAIYTPEKAGKLTFRLRVRSTDLKGKDRESVTTHQVIAYRRKILLVADSSIDDSAINLLRDAAMENGIFVDLVKGIPTSASLSEEDSIVSQLTGRLNLFTGADSIVVWGSGIEGLQALMRAIDGNTAYRSTVRYQTVVVITGHGLTTVSRIARSAFSFLNPAQIIVTRKEALNSLTEIPVITDFRSSLEQRGIPQITLTAATVRYQPWDLFSIFINFMLSHGVAGQTVILLLMLPVIATIFTFLKQVIGITTFGLYTPSIVALSFLALGWQTGLIFLLFILVSGYVTRALMRPWRLLYYPKVAIILTAVCLTLLLLTGLGTWAGVSFALGTVFILLILSTLAENFINLKTEEGLWSAFLAIAETVLGALLCVFIVSLPSFQTLILAYPELIILTIFINIFLGRWTGLRLVEYFRFYEVIKHLHEEE
ncbi:hypothetical protein A3J34_05050 [Candidatus Peribacteria bacterium RIFCSPLOWO2_02_FULL_51_10]|nr:MAG: hypothetical protein A3C52_02660 [Candidatus Peribacteria bacterium RIFCSPHIGHO2_02_FULL_51_15]OGJ68067.1 MAG: hypothetical protein A3J34_05050 [Candidatus Peribacteria bacterium RIFCSPLOWO2_02_FULL_51_10]